MQIRSKFALAVLCAGIGHAATFAPIPGSGDKARLIVMADMGHDPDEEQQIAHLLACSNEFELEGLIAVTGRFFRKNPTEPVKYLMPELFQRLIDGYEKVYPNLKLHAEGWREPDRLRSIVARGQEGNGVGDTGDGKSSAGSRLIIRAATSPDPRPVHIVINAGSNTLAQALYDYRRSHSAEEVEKFVSKLLVYDNGGQDEAGAWILHEFPNIHWVRAVSQNRTWGGPSNRDIGPHVWKPHPYSTEGQHAWAAEHVQTGHGALGALYPDRTVNGVTHFIEGGGTIPWTGLVARGLGEWSRPAWGGWSGRYSRLKQSNVQSYFHIVRPDEEQYLPFEAYTDRNDVRDRWTNPADGKTYYDVYAATWRWRQAMWNDFQCRMDWCVRPYAEANHHPVAVLNGDESNAILKTAAKPGGTIELDAAGSRDPDDDGLIYTWYVYAEAGTYGGSAAIQNPNAASTRLELPGDSRHSEIHVILEVRDDSAIASLSDYRRLIIEVE